MIVKLRIEHVLILMKDLLFYSSLVRIYAFNTSIYIHYTTD